MLGRRRGATLEIYGDDEMSKVKEAASCSGHGGIPSVGDAGGGGRYGALDLMTSIKGLGRRLDAGRRKGDAGKSCRGR